jgi:asparagine synthase (glutamine-hydrolysing)
LAHRGPDEGGWWAEGQFFLGHRRLSIIDLSSGQQPMATADGRLVVVFNGEIYNYIETRAELESRGHRFVTKSDTEVLLHGYREWGTELPGHLTGMFAFALADREKRELYLARDRFGEKPLFLLRGADWVAFASELRPLAALPDRPRRMNLEALGAYLTLNYVPGTATLLDGVERLAPANWRLFSAQGERGGRFWKMPESAVQARPPAGTPAGALAPLENSLAELREHFDRAVRLNLRSDVPVGIFLSGGLDSALVAEAAMRQGRLNRAFTIDFEEASYGEYQAARLVAQRLGLPLERVVLTPAALADFAKLVEHADDPLADSSALAVWTLARHTAACGNKVVLGGDGGDELFAGYLTYRATQLHDRYVRRWPGLVRRLASAVGRRLPTTEGKVTFSYKLRRFLRAAHLPTGQAHFSWNGTWLPDEAAALLRPGLPREAAAQALLRLAERSFQGSPRRLLDLQENDAREYLANDILVKTDRMTMAHGLELRAPFLEHELAAWCLRRPEREKVSPRGELKVLLRAAARRLFGPAIADRPKHGFSIPIHAWVRGPLGATIRELLAPASVERLEYLDPAAVQAVVEDHFARRRSYGFELWGLAVLVAWHRARIQHPPPPPRLIPLAVRTFPRLWGGASR